MSGEVVALKTYSKRRLSDLNWYQVEREIRLHGQLRHPNIIQLHAAFEDDTHVFMVCEYAAGGRAGKGVVGMHAGVLLGGGGGGAAGAPDLGKQRCRTRAGPTGLWLPATCRWRPV